MQRLPTHPCRCLSFAVIGEAGAAQRSAILYTIIEACRSRGIDPQSYLRDVLTHLPTLTNRQIKEVTPEAWAKARSQSTRTSTSPGKHCFAGRQAAA